MSAPDHLPGRFDAPDLSRPRRRFAVALFLALLCCIIYLPGLDALGVYGWQEGQRLLVAREMQQRAAAAQSTAELAQALLVPTAHGVPYIAKPPIFYWAQIALASLTRTTVELWHMRLLAALSAIAGVFLTVFAARVMLQPDPPDSAAQPPFPVWLDKIPLNPALVSSSALWAGVLLATGALYVHSGRIGEVDILLAAACTAALAALAAAWRSHRLARRTNFSMIALATLACTIATMTKDPGVLIVALAGYGGILLHAAFAPAGTLVDAAVIRGRGRADRVALPPTSHQTARWQIALAAACGLVSVPFAARTVEHPVDWLGVAAIALACGWIAYTLLRLTSPLRFRTALVALSRTHPIIVLGVPIVVAVAWRLVVAGLIGDNAARALVDQEIDDNLRLFVAEAPLNNLKAFAIGLGLTSGLAIFGLIWLFKDRPRLSPAHWQIVAWIICMLVAFSLLGKGVQRYLTPMWPAVAILAGLTLASLLAAHPRAVWLRRVSLAAVLALAVGQSWYFASGRVRTQGDRSPRAFVAELRTLPGVDLDRLTSVDMSSPGLSFSCDQRIETVGYSGVNTSMSGGASMTPVEFAALVEHHGEMLTLAASIEQSTDAIVPIASETITQLQALGLVFLPLNPHPVARFENSNRQIMICYRVTKPATAGLTP